MVQNCWALQKSAHLNKSRTINQEEYWDDKNISAPWVRAETGTHSVYSQLTIKIFTYWQRIPSMDLERLPKISLE